MACSRNCSKNRRPRRKRKQTLILYLFKDISYAFGTQIKLKIGEILRKKKKKNCPEMIFFILSFSFSREFEPLGALTGPDSREMFCIILVKPGHGYRQIIRMKKKKIRKETVNGWEWRKFAFANQPGERANCIFFLICWREGSSDFTEERGGW